MESNLPKEPKEKDDVTKEIMELFGESTDYLNELIDSNLDDKEIEIKEGEYIEKYFNQKLKYLLKSKNAFSTTIDTQKIKEEMILSINYALLYNPSLDEKTAKKIVKKIVECFKNEPSFQIDTFLPMVDGKNLKIFFDSIKNYSFPQSNKIEINKKYTVIVTFSLSSQIIKKSDQLRKSFLLFSFIHKLYLDYPNYIKKFYEYFVQKFILRKKVNTKMLENVEEEENKKFDLSPYGNYVFIIVSNKTLKSFRETENLEENYYFQEEFKVCPDAHLTKCFKNEDENKNGIIIKNDIIPINPDKDKLIGKDKIQESSNSNDEKIDFIEISKKESKDHKLLKSYKELNYLITNINKENNCIVKLIYLDTYLDMVTPKCELVKEMTKLSKKLNIIMNYLSKKDPNFMNSLIDSEKK